jgi:hypothetical protein
MPPLITVERFGPFQASIVTSPGQITASIISFVLPYTTLADPQISLSLYINYLISFRWCLITWRWGFKSHSAARLAWYIHSSWGPRKAMELKSLGDEPAWVTRVRRGRKWKRKEWKYLISRFQRCIVEWWGMWWCDVLSNKYFALLVENLLSGKMKRWVMALSLTSCCLHNAGARTSPSSS